MSTSPMRASPGTMAEQLSSPLSIQTSISNSSMQSSSSFLDNLSAASLSSSCSSIASGTFFADTNTAPLSDQMIVQCLLYNSINIFSKRHANVEIYCKMTSFHMDSSFDMPNQTTGMVSIDEESIGFGDECPMEIAVMNDLEYKFHAQEQFGRVINRNEFLMFRAKMGITEHCGIRLDMFKKSTIGIDGQQEVIFDKIAFGYIYPVEIRETNGIWMMPITSKSGKIIAKFKAEYFIMKPYAGYLPEDVKIKVKTRDPKCWQVKKNGYDIGHRGAGSAKRVYENEKILENTVSSFNFAFKKGADMVELDVQLSKDKVPIVYHDFNVNIVLQKKDRDIETFEINIKDLTFNQLQKLKLNPVLHGNEFYDFEEDTGMPCNQPFASFKTVLESVDPQCGFNVEIKYPQKKIDGQWESEKSLDLNEYVDLILQDIFSYGGERNIIISSFHPEICSLVKIKQERYPVLFLTQGLTTKWMQFENALNHSIEMATYFATNVGLFGIAVHAEDIIKNRNLIRFVKSKPLVLFCWGDDLNDKELIKQLKREGIDGAIYDKIDLLLSKDDQFTIDEPMDMEPLTNTCF